MRSIFGSPKQVAEDVRESIQTVELRALLFFAVTLIAIGTTFYMWKESWDLIEAFYFCVATLTTVGYGDLHPTSDASRLFTAFYALAGVGFILTFVTVVARRASQSFADRKSNEQSSSQEPKE
jgi:hypothetical protein